MHTSPLVLRRATALLALLAVLATLPLRASAAGRSPLEAGWPLAGSPAVVRVFQRPALPYGPGHRGVDLQGRVGAPVLAAADGTVRFAGVVAGRGVVTLDHGGVTTTYEPVEVSVRVGDRVRLGQPIGLLQPGGHCDGCLHWGLRRGGTYLDPLSLVGGTGGEPSSGQVRLVAERQRAVVRREAAARAALAAAEALAGASSWVAGPGGHHGFSHPVPGGITSGFGMRFHPVLHRTKLHDGTDFGAACGTPIRAPYAGRVTRAYANPGYGNRLFLDHGTVDGRRVQTAYNHATRYVVAPGAAVERGQVIGYVGSTGFSTGCHLHLMVWLDGHLVDPMTWL